MFPLFTKSLNQLTWADVEELVNAGATENQTIEFKVDLQVEDGGKHPWHAGGRTIDSYARDDILKEIVAFANADGGNLILGMAESRDHEKRATKARPLPRCKELADRLRQLSESWIEPALPALEWKGIAKTDNDDDGAVIARVPGSRLAPHRLRGTREFYVRRGENSEPMTIREIHDSVLRSASTFDAVKRRLDERVSKPYQLLDTFREGRLKTNEWAMRITVLPVSAPVSIDRPYEYDQLFPMLDEFNATVSGRAITLNIGPTGRNLGLQRVSPILGGGRREQWLRERKTVVSQEVHNDGMVEFMVRVEPSEETGGARVSAGLVLGLGANALKIADTVRNLGGAPSAELVVDVEIRTARGRAYLSWFESNPADEEKSHFHTTSIHLPRYTAAGPETLPEVMKRLMNSLRESAGLRAIDDFSISLG